MTAAAVLNGTKRITIREGHRDYRKGKVLIGCHILNWVTMEEITEVIYTNVKCVSKQEYIDDGFKSRKDMLVGLQKFYPGMSMKSDVTIVRWK